MTTPAAPDPIYSQLFPSSPAKGDERRLKIILTTIDCIAAHGAEQASFAQVGEMAGMRPSHVNYYFKTREELTFAAIQYCIYNAQAMTVERIAGKKSIRDKVRAKIEAALDHACQFPSQAAVILYFQYACTFNPEFRQLLKDARETGHRRLVALLTEGFKNSKTKREIETMASKIHLVSAGVLFDSIALGGKKIDPEVVQNGIRLVLSMFDEF